MLLAIVASAVFGAADFLGGLATRRAPAATIVIMSQAAGLVLLAIALPVLPHASATRLDVAWGAAAGLAGGIGVALLYRGLALGPMSIVAPVTAVCAVAVPVIVGISLGDRLTTVTAAGIAAAVVAVALAGQSGSDAAGAGGRDRPRVWRALRIALASGIVIGLFLVALQRTAPAAGMWPLVVARTVSISLFCAVALLGRQPLFVGGRGAALALGGGVLDMVANVCYLVAVRDGPLSIIATLSSLYPASTVVLARVVLHERLTRQQAIGIAAAAAAIVMIVRGSVR